MRIKDKIASEILDYLEGNVKGLFELREEEYLDIECAIADIIEKQFNHYLNFDVDFGKVI